MKFDRMLLPAVVRTPLVQNRSLIASGNPSSGRTLPFAMRASEASAIASAFSGVSVTKALSMRAPAIAPTKACVSSRDEIFFARTASRASASVKSVGLEGSVMAYSSTFGTTKK
jgi:hypothetical protein